MATSVAAADTPPKTANGRDEAVFSASRWRSAAIPTTLAILALVLFLPRLTTPPTYVFDELYYAYTAGRYVAGDPGAYDTAILPQDDPAIEWTHPPLAKLVIAGGILLFGDGPVGWRAASVLFGVLGIVVAYFLAREIAGSRAVGAVAAGLLLFDGLYFVESRIGTSNMLLLALANGALLATVFALKAPPSQLGPPLLAAGILLGLALATKWSAVALAGLIGLAVCWRGFWGWRVRRRAGDAVAARAWAAAYLRWLPVAFVVVPVAIYLGSYLHFFLSGHDWAGFIDLHRDMLAYHRGVGAPHPDSSPWWEWPLAAGPVWYFVAERRREGVFVFANSNPLLVWPMVVAVAWVAVDWWGRRPAALTVLLIGFFGQWLPWALAPRGTFSYHFLPALPLGCAGVAVLVVDAWNGGSWRRGFAVAYVVAAVAVFAFFYPLYAAVPLTPEQLDARLWFDAWR